MVRGVGEGRSRLPGSTCVCFGGFGRVWGPVGGKEEGTPCMLYSHTVYVRAIREKHFQLSGRNSGHVSTEIVDSSNNFLSAGRILSQDI